jgi:predicted dienelactone hydrolase
MVPSTTTTSRPPGPPYRVTESTFTLVDTSRPTVSEGRQLSTSRTLTTTVWAPAAPGRRPLVVFAHGFGVGPSPYFSLLETWAAHGYVVAAPAFPLTDQQVAGSYLDENDIQNQPADVRFVTDWLVSALDPLAARIDPARVSVAGHSDGAETALAAATTLAPPGQPHYRCVLVFSGQPVPNGAGANPPILVVQGDVDDINPQSLGQAVYQQAARPRYYLDLKGGGHLPPFESGSAWLPGIEAVTGAFLDAYGAGDAPAASVSARSSAYTNLSISSG